MSECVSGAVSEQEYIGAIKRAGFEKVKVEERAVFTHEQLSEFLRGGGHIDDQRLAEIDLEQLVASYKVSAVKPK